MVDTFCWLGNNTSFCLCFSVMVLKMHETDIYSEVLFFIDPHISWLRSYFRTENLELPEPQAMWSHI